ncbi:MAG: DVUA0089 family protein [Nitrososphaerota archaeon]
MSSPFFLSYVSAEQQYYLKVYYQEALVNGVRLDPSNPQIVVNPGQSLSGYLRVRIENVQPGSWITPVIGTTSWTRGRFNCITNWAPTGSSSQQYSFDLTAPSQPGTYYIGIFTGWMYSCDEVASNDHPPNYGDRDDVWDMPSQGWEEVIANGQASTGPYKMLGRAIKIIVQQSTQSPRPKVSVDAFPSQIRLGEYLTVTIRGRNEGSLAEEGDLVIQFPSGNPTDISIVSSDAPSNNRRIVRTEDRVYCGNYGQSHPDCTIYARYPGVWIWETPWNSNVQRYLTVRVRPTQAGEFVFYVKLVMKVQGQNTWVADPSPGSTSHIDQQNEYVYRYTVNILQPDRQPPQLTLFTPEVNGLTVRINGVTLPGTPGTTITRIHWDWGDGYSEDHWFPASHTYSRAGTYTITVTSYQSDGLSTTKSVTIRLEPSVGDSFEPDNTMAQAKEIMSGERQQRSIDPIGDIDWAKFTLNQRSRVALETSGLGKRDYDTVIELYDSQGILIDWNDDYGGTYWSRIERELDAGTYYVKVYEYGNNGKIPEYILSLELEGSEEYILKEEYDIDNQYKLFVGLRGSRIALINTPYDYTLEVEVRDKFTDTVSDSGPRITSGLFILIFDRRKGPNFYPYGAGESDPMGRSIRYYTKPSNSPVAEWYGLYQFPHLRDGLLMTLEDILIQILLSLPGKFLGPLDLIYSSLIAFLKIVSQPPIPPIIDRNQYTIWEIPLAYVSRIDVWGYHQWCKLEFINEDEEAQKISIWGYVKVGDRYYVVDSEITIAVIKIIPIAYTPINIG